MAIYRKSDYEFYYSDESLNYTERLLANVYLDNGFSKFIRVVVGFLMVFVSMSALYLCFCRFSDIDKLQSKPALIFGLILVALVSAGFFWLFTSNKFKYFEDVSLQSYDLKNVFDELKNEKDSTEHILGKYHICRARELFLRGDRIMINLVNDYIKLKSVYKNSRDITENSNLKKDADRSLQSNSETRIELCKEMMSHVDSADSEIINVGKEAVDCVKHKLSEGSNKAITKPNEDVDSVHRPAVQRPKRDNNMNLV